MMRESGDMSVSIACSSDPVLSSPHEQIIGTEQESSNNIAFPS